MIIRRCRSGARLESTRVKSCLPPQYAYDSPKYVFGSSCPVNLVQPARLGIVIKQRPRLLVIEREPLSYCLFVIIRSGEQLFAVQITNAFMFTWLEVDVVYRPAGAACLPALKKLVASGEVTCTESAVLFNTGAGVKYLEAFSR